MESFNIDEVYAKLDEIEAKKKAIDSMDVEAMLKEANQKILNKLQTDGVKENECLVCKSCVKAVNTPFCPDCGQKTVPATYVKCSGCGYEPKMEGVIPKFCGNCGHQYTGEDLKLSI